MKRHLSFGCEIAMTKFTAWLKLNSTRFKIAKWKEIFNYSWEPGYSFAMIFIFKCKIFAATEELFNQSALNSLPGTKINKHRGGRLISEVYSSRGNNSEELQITITSWYRVRKQISFFFAKPLFFSPSVNNFQLLLKKFARRISQN